MRQAEKIYGDFKKIRICTGLPGSSNTPYREIILPRFCGRIVFERILKNFILGKIRILRFLNRFTKMKKYYYINKWLAEGLISPQQADKMRSDIEKDFSQKNAKKIIWAFSIIGSSFAAIGIVLFVASNWEFIAPSVKILMLASLTFACAFGGFFLKYENKNYPKTGGSLLFLSSLLIGALISLVSQIYHCVSPENLYILVFLWLVLTMPYIYIFNSKPAAVLSCVLSVIWINSFFSHINLYKNTYDKFVLTLTVNCLLGIIIFCTGKLNAFKKSLSEISEVCEKFAVFIIFASLFFLTFPSFYGTPAYSLSLSKTSLLPFPVVLLLTAVPMFCAVFFANPSKTNENSQNLMIAAAAAFCAYLISGFCIRQTAATLFFAAMILLLIFSGYKKRQMFYVNLAAFWLIVFTVVQYFNCFWKLLPRSLFFVAGGILLIVSAFFFEHKRRNLKTEMKTYEP